MTDGVLSRPSYAPRLWRTTSARVSLGLLAIVLGGFGVLGPLLIGYAPDAIDLSQRLAPPGAAHLLGTDELGRDLLSRIVHGTAISVGGALAVATATVGLGLLLGGLSGLWGGWLDAVLMRCMDVMLSLPALVLAIALAAALGPGLQNALLALIVVRLPVFVRLARAQALALRSQPFVEAAQLLGGSRAYLLRHHLLPNMLPVMLVQALTDVAGLILASAALGFIGLGAQPPAPEWGALVAASRYYVAEAWWYALFPGLAILLSSTAFNLLGDALRDVMDPKE